MLIRASYLMALASLYACEASQSVMQVSSPSPASELSVAATMPVGTTAPIVGVVNAELSQGSPSKRSSEDEQMQELFRHVWQKPSFQQALAENYLRGSEIDPALTQREAQFRQEVLMLISEDRLVDAIARLQTLQGQNAVFDFMIGQIYFGQQKFGEAAVELTKAVAKQINFRRAWKSLAMAKMRLGEYAAARQAMRRVIALGEVSAESYGFMGAMNAKAGDLMAAETAFRLAMMLEPDEERWLTFLATSLKLQGRFHESVSMLSTLLAEQPNRADLWLAQAEQLIDMEDYQRAAENLEIVDQLGVADYKVLTTLGRIYQRQDLFDMATDAYLRAIPLGAEQSPKLLIKEATVMAQRSAYYPSQRLLAEIAAVYGDKMDADERVELQRMQSRVAMAVGDTEAKVGFLAEIVRENPLDGDALMQLGQYYQGKGEAEQAILRYEQAAQVAEYAATAKGLHANLLITQSKFAEAIPLLESSLQLKPRDDVMKLLEFAKRAAAVGR